MTKIRVPAVTSAGEATTESSPEEQSSVPDTPARTSLTLDGGISPKSMPLNFAIAMGGGCFVSGMITMGLISYFTNKPVSSPKANPPAVVAAMPVPEKPAPMKKPAKLSDLFKSQSLTYIKSAGKLAAMTSQGVNLRDFSGQLATTRSDLELLEEMWPKDLDRSPVFKFRDSIQAYDLALKLWEMKIDKSDNPCEPDINGWGQFVAFAKDDLAISIHPEDYLVKHYRGKKFLPFDSNISVLMTVGSRHFTTGRDQLLTVME